MAKGFGSLAQLIDRASLKVGTAAPALEPRREVRVEPQYVEGDNGVGTSQSATYTGPLPSADPAEYPEWALRWVHAGVQTLGRKHIESALDDGGIGNNADHARLERKIESALDRLPKSRADQLRPDLFSLYRGKGCPTHCGNARTVMDALAGGAYDAWLAQEREEAGEAEGLVVPKPEESEDLEIYRARLETWAAGKQVALLKRIGFDVYDIVRAEEKRREAVREAAEARKLADATNVFLAGGSFEDLVAGSDSWKAKEIAFASPRAWEMVVTMKGGHDYISSPTVAPTGDWLAEQTNLVFLAKGAMRAREEYRGLFRGRLIELLPLKPGPTTVSVVLRQAEEESSYVHWFAITADRVVEGIYASKGEEAPPSSGRYDTQPHEFGWVRMPTSGREEAKYFSPKKYEAYSAVHAHKGAGLDVEAWMPFYGRHPEKGFGRFRIGVVAGAAHRDFKVVSVDDRAAKYLDALQNFPREYALPVGAFHLPLRLVKKTDQGGHIVWDDRETRQAVAVTEKASWVQMSMRSSGGTIGTSGGDAAAWSCSSSTNKHLETAVFALIREGEKVDLDSGASVVCRDGKAVKIPGGAGK